MSEYAKFSSALRKLGFKKELDSRAGGVRTTIFKKQVGERRRVNVQIWGARRAPRLALVQRVFRHGPDRFLYLGGRGPKSRQCFTVSELEII